MSSKEKASDNSASANIVLPAEPTKPSVKDCCGNGCSVCVFDLYERQLKAWREKCATILSGSECACEDSATVSISENEFNSFEILFISEVDDHCNNTVKIIVKVPLFKRATDCAWHVVARLWSADGLQLSRSYTPLIPVAAAQVLQSHADLLELDRDYIALLIKLYPNGKFSSLLREIKSGDNIELLGPVISHRYSPNKFRNILFLAGGTGVLPFLQLLENILLIHEEEESGTRLLYSTQCYDEIHCHNLLHSWTNYWNFSLKYFISQEPDVTKILLKWGETVEWCRLTKSHLIQEIKSIDTCKDAIFLCGPPDYEKCILTYLEELNMSSCLIRL